MRSEIVDIFAVEKEADFLIKHKRKYEKNHWHHTAFSPLLVFKPDLIWELKKLSYTFELNISCLGVYYPRFGEWDWMCFVLLIVKAKKCFSFFSAGGYH